MPNKDRRTKADLLAALDDRSEKLKQLAEMLREKDKMFAEKDREHSRDIDKLEREIFLLKLGDKERRKLLKLQALGSIRVASFLEGKVEGVMTALKTVLNNTKTDDGDFPPELGKILEEMAQDLADVDDDFDGEDELGID